MRPRLAGSMHVCAIASQAAATGQVWGGRALPWLSQAWRTPAAVQVGVHGTPPLDDELLVLLDELLLALELLLLELELLLLELLPDELLLDALLLDELLALLALLVAVAVVGMAPPPPVLPMTPG